MERRIFLAIVLSLMIIIGWAALSSRFYPVEQQEVKSKEIMRLPTPSLPDIPAEPALLPEEQISINQQELTFILPYAAIKEVRFKDYQDSRLSLLTGLLWNDATACKEQRLGPDSYFIYRDEDKMISKRFIFHPSEYILELKINVKNLRSSALDINSSLVLARLDVKADRLEGMFQQAVLAHKDKVVRLNPRRQFHSNEEIKFLAFRNRYFCAIVEPESSGFRGYINKLNSNQIEIGLTYQTQLEPAEERDLNFLIYLGPQELRILSALQPEWQQVIYYGAFDGISKLLLKLLTIFHSIAHNWGFALVILTCFIYLIFYPLNLKQIHSMKKMQELQPKTEQLRKLYKDNPQRLNKEILELYRREKINPFGGCLPLLLQIPIFFALYQGLMRSLELKGASFLWIKDLSEPDRLFTLSQPLPFLGNEINLLPLLMMGVMFLQQKVSQATAVGQAAEQQRIMGIMLPLLFGVIFYRMPSGLVLYWFLNSLLMFLNQYRLKTRH